MSAAQAKHRGRVSVVTGMWHTDGEVREIVNEHLGSFDDKDVVGHELIPLIDEGRVSFVSVVRYRESAYEGLPADDGIIHDEPGQLGETGRDLEVRAYTVLLEPGITLWFECSRDTAPAMQSGFVSSKHGGEVILPGKVVLVKAPRKPKEAWDRAQLLGIDFGVPVVAEGDNGETEQ